MHLTRRFFLVIALILLSGLYILPWHKFDVQIPFLLRPYTLGLDLQGGVELDYEVDFSALKKQDVDGKQNEGTIIEGLKNIIDKRVNSLGLAEPTIQTLKYGSNVHLIVQIPTKAYGELSPEERQKQQAVDIQNAKDTIGKVVQLEFREQKIHFDEQDYKERKELALEAKKDLENIPFSTVAAKYSSQYENVSVYSGTGTIPAELAFSGIESIAEFPYASDVIETQNPEIRMGEDGQPITETNTGYSLLFLENQIGSGEYTYASLTIDAKPSGWTPAKTQNGKVLNDKYLTTAGVSFNNVGQPQVELTFNDEGKNIFAELSKRLLGKQFAIFVGGQLLTAPTIQAVITDGKAVITGNYSVGEAQELANNINTGIVPAPIYLTSERTIDAKIGESALGKILHAGAIGLLLIIIFLTVLYNVGGILAGVALVTYTLLLIVIVKMTGVVLTLASIAGIILSIGLAIDANILIFERIHEALREGHPASKAMRIGFEHSWTAIWDSHVTSFISALILYIFGISMIKGFGLMLGIGILLSLFTAMWVSRILIMFAEKYIKNKRILIGYKK